MSEIPTKIAAELFARFFELYLSRAARCYACQIPRYKLFNYLVPLAAHWLPIGRDSY